MLNYFDNIDLPHRKLYKKKAPEWLPELNLGLDVHVHEDVEEIQKYKEDHLFS